ncbi:MAG: hypothetical protein EA350_16345 [Gemmatimonadales bacterium]|nr:MAG: hypothetical protein EA350_16345 [Gemmatimonadales bacterium]
MLSFQREAIGGSSAAHPPEEPPLSRTLSERELCDWLEAQAPELARRWSLELRARSGRDEGELEPLRDAILAGIVRFLSPAVGPWRDQVEPLLQQVAALYGNVACLRGLAAGDVVEEIQLLREILFRFLFRESSPEEPANGVGIRELLRLSRVVDHVVTHANVGHIDGLFFNLLHGSGVTSLPGEEKIGELASELSQLQEELDQMRPVVAPRSQPPRN